MTREEFNSWVDTMIKGIDYKRFFTYRLDTTETSGRRIVPPKNRTVICYDEKTHKVGVAICHPDDEFNMSIGKAIAYARCRGYSIPKIDTYKTLKQMKHGDVFAYGGQEFMFISYVFDNLYAVYNAEFDTVEKLYNDNSSYRILAD